MQGQWSLMAFRSAGMAFGQAKTEMLPSASRQRAESLRLETQANMK